MKKQNTKQNARSLRSLLKELPYFNFTGDLSSHLGQFNNSISSDFQTKRRLI